MYLLGILYFFLPLINFLNDINLPQISNNDYIWIFIFYILILFLFSIIYFCIFKFYKNITKYLFIIPLSYFFSFFYRDIFNYLGLIYFILINISIIILYLIFIMLLILCDFSRYWNGPLFNDTSFRYIIALLYLYL